MDFIEEAVKIARRSDIRKHKTGAVILKDAKIVSNGWSHVPHYKLRSKRSLHAEIHALGRARHLDLKGAVVAIATIASKSGNVVGAKPCLDCAIALHAAGVMHVHYTINSQWNDSLNLSAPAIFDDLKVYERNGN